MHHEFTPEQIAHFWSYVDRSGGPDACWPWMRSCVKAGYGQIMFNRIPWRANRLAWILTHGAIPTGLNVCHTCDNPPCCNPAHLWVGTRKENTADMVQKGRHNRPHARFTDDEVREFRRRHAAGESPKVIAESVNHDLSAMCKLLRGLHYRHVT